MKFFAYGQYLDKFERRCVIGERDFEKAYINDARLTFKGKFMGVPAIESAKGCKVAGIILDVKKAELSSLKNHMRESYLYKQGNVKVTTRYGDIKAKTFVPHEVHNKFELKYMMPSAKLFNSIKTGIDEVGWPAKNADDALNTLVNKIYRGE